MIIISDFDKISDFWKEITAEEYGFSTLGEPDESEIYERDDVIHLLEDWTWTGDPSKKPDWLKRRKKKD